MRKCKRKTSGQKIPQSTRKNGRCCIENREKNFSQKKYRQVHMIQKAANQSHIELFEIDIKQFEENGTIVEKRVYVVCLIIIKEIR